MRKSPDIALDSKMEQHRLDGSPSAIGKTRWVRDGEAEVVLRDLVQIQWEPLSRLSRENPVSY